MSILQIGFFLMWIGNKLFMLIFLFSTYGHNELNGGGISLNNIVVVVEEWPPPDVSLL
jgi:hypothetical protein